MAIDPSEVIGGALIPTGVAGAAAATRYVGGTASGAPATGAFLVGDFVVDQTGKVWICTAAGTPGTWTQAGGGGGGGNLAQTLELELTTIAATAVVTANPTAAGLYTIKVYFRVTVASTNVTVTVTHTDATGMQTTTIVPLTNFTVDSYAEAAVVVYGAAGDAITVDFTAGTANQVYASAAIGAV
ncbi:MAG: hypothetical protein ACREN4_07275 [Candidatus Dormibacteria bacterium]